MQKSKKNRILFIAGTDLSPELLIENMSNNNDFYYENDFDETRTDSEIKGKPFGNFMSMVSASVENSVKSEVASSKNETVSVVGFPG